jgi:hypothetical protein
MRRIFTSVLLVGAVLLAVPQSAEAQYYGPPPGGGYGGGGYGHGGGYGYGAPQPAPRWGYRHRIHGYVGAQLTGIGIINEKTDYTTGGYLGGGGGGGGIFGGVRLGPFFSLELNWNITYHNVQEDWGYYSAFHLQVIELNGKIHIPTQSIVEPYVQLGIGFAFLGASWDDSYCGYHTCYVDSGDYIFAKGFDFNIGGGLDIWLSPFMSLGGRVLYKGMRFGEPTYSTKSGTTSTKYANFASAINFDLNVALHF